MCWQHINHKPPRFNIGNISLTKVKQRLGLTWLKHWNSQSAIFQAWTTISNPRNAFTIRCSVAIFGVSAFTAHIHPSQSAFLARTSNSQFALKGRHNWISQWWYIKLETNVANTSHWVREWVSEWVIVQGKAMMGPESYKITVLTVTVSYVFN